MWRAETSGWRVETTEITVFDVESVECLGLFRCDVLLKDEATFDVLKLSALREPKVPSQGLFWLQSPPEKVSLRTSGQHTTVRAGLPSVPVLVQSA